MTLFVNYRVGDGEDKAAWLDAELRVVFGDERVFRASRSIDLGHDYGPIMWGAVGNCSAMIVVIGERRLSEFRDRLWDPDDVVRKEIATVLAAGKPVIPVLGLIGPMPRADELPPDLAKLANCQYIRLSYRDQHLFPGLTNRLITDVPELGIGVRDGIRDLTTWNRDHAVGAVVGVSEEFVLLGRDDAVATMRSWLTCPPGNLVVQGKPRTRWPRSQPLSCGSMIRIIARSW